MYSYKWSWLTVVELSILLACLIKKKKICTPCWLSNPETCPSKLPVVWNVPYIIYYRSCRLCEVFPLWNHVSPVGADGRPSNGAPALVTRLWICHRAKCQIQVGHEARNSLKYVMLCYNLWFCLTLLLESTPYHLNKRLASNQVSDWQHPGLIDSASLIHICCIKFILKLKLQVKV